MSVLRHPTQRRETSPNVGRGWIAWKALSIISSAPIPRSGMQTFRPLGVCSTTKCNPGVNLIYYGDGRQLEYDFQVQPGADLAECLSTLLAPMICIWMRTVI